MGSITVLAGLTLAASRCRVLCMSEALFRGTSEQQEQQQHLQTVGTIDPILKKMAYQELLECKAALEARIEEARAAIRNQKIREKAEEDAQDHLKSVDGASTKSAVLIELWVNLEKLENELAEFYEIYLEPAATQADEDNAREFNKFQYKALLSVRPPHSTEF